VPHRARWHLASRLPAIPVEYSDRDGKARLFLPRMRRRVR